MIGLVIMLVKLKFGILVGRMNIELSDCALDSPGIYFNDPMMLMSYAFVFIICD